MEVPRELPSQLQQLCFRPLSRLCCQIPEEAMAAAVRESSASILRLLQFRFFRLQLWCCRHSVIDGIFSTLAGNEALRYFGVLAFSIGFVIMNWAAFSLGRQFSTEVTTQENHELITSGLYRYVRHPRYAGTLIFFVGISLLFLSLVGIGISVLLMIVLLWRIADEEKFMEQQFQGAWRSYVRTTKKLIPFCY